DRIAGHALEDRAGPRWRHQSSVVEDEVDVHAAELFDPALLDRVEENDLVAPVRAGLLLRDEAGRVVARALRRSGAARCRAGVLLRQPDRHRMQATREIRTGGR